MRTRHEAPARATAHVRAPATPEDALEEKRAVASTCCRCVDNRHAMHEDRGDAFGWETHVDAASNTLYYVHSYTGEVRLAVHEPREQDVRGRVGSAFGLHQLYDEAPSQWHPQYVMLPTGITPSQPRTLQLDSWRGGYACHPMNQTSRTILQDAQVPEEQAESLLKSEYRVLPSTWECSPHGPPFLAPFPVAILAPVYPLDHPTSLPYVCTDEVWRPEPQYYPEVLPTYDFTPHQQPAPIPSFHPTDMAHPPGVDRREKAHNRRGYHLRQARKLMKKLGPQSTQSVLTLVEDLRHFNLSPPAIQAN